MANNAPLEFRSPLEGAYVLAHVQATELLDDIDEHLKNMPAPACGHPVCWDDVSQLNRITALLLEVKTFLER